MPTEDFGPIHHSGNGRYFPRVFRFISVRIIAPLWWAVERLAQRLSGVAVASRCGSDARRALHALRAVA